MKCTFFILKIDLKSNNFNMQNYVSINQRATCSFPLQHIYHRNLHHKVYKNKNNINKLCNIEFPLQKLRHTSLHHKTFTNKI